MLDPFTALGLAGNVAQLVELTGKLLSQARELRGTGTVRSANQIRDLTIDILKQIQAFRKSVKDEDQEGSTPGEDNQVRDLPSFLELSFFCI
jgi:hypothetical protein